MAYLVLARKYRPPRFEDVVGQEAIAQTLTHAIETGRVAHAYLFAGPRGVGKTSMARILSKALNCETGTRPDPCKECANCQAIAQGSDMDVLEIDGASNRGIEEVRAIRENAAYQPTRSKYRIYIIDEVHMLTPQAFNALLKTLEEPPPHVKFIFATTQPQNIPETIRSRCQRFDFRQISPEAIAQRLEEICAAEDVSVERNALETIAQRARGGMRDAQSLLDQVFALGKERVRVDDVRAILGWVSIEELGAVVDALAGGQPDTLLRLVATLLERGQDMGEFLLQLGEVLRDLLIVKSCRGEPPVPMVSGTPIERLRMQAEGISAENLTYMLQVVQETRRRLSRDVEGRILMEMALLRLAALKDLEPIDRALTRLQETEPPKGKPVTPPPPEGTEAGDAEEPSPSGPGETWKTLLEALRSEKPQLTAYLREGRLVESSEEKWVVGFPEDRGFHKDRVQAPENLALIRETLQRLLGRPVDLTFVSLEEKGGVVIEGLKEEKIPSRRPRPKTEPQIVQKAKKLFRGRVVEE
ncbi:MAG: DNA polymerase III subunit gamma/tau [Planctomycetota bacterium]|jgi:DNA polymerase-3 subunit gamma/tau